MVDPVVDAVTGFFAGRVPRKKLDKTLAGPCNGLGSVLALLKLAEWAALQSGDQKLLNLCLFKACQSEISEGEADVVLAMFREVESVACLSAS
ncbi:MAG: hypothetical protein HYZ11_08310 [Candidatus Tectomicrobia bacterium]|uniref:Uncharacterized protein n=1 Tax=Tectimicrobiota bacterium TaxID=2528274 RepID=A0A932HXN1_UNCTE|nr:hypothetical protein [Candidatus Tectomicrobia bacterium]